MYDFRFKHNTFLLLALIVLTIMSYSNTFFVPFYFDDKTSLIDLERLYNQDTFALFKAMKLRFIAYLTFKMNYQFHEFDVFGYHVVNLAVHCINVVLVFLLTRELQFHFINQKTSSRFVQYLPILTAAFFALHPLHTQAVTYIVQRLASLSALFYFLSIASFLYVRRTHSKTVGCVFVFALLLGAFTKQNFFSVFLVITLIELMIRGSNRLWLLSAITIIAVFVVWQLGSLHQYSWWISLDSFSRETLDFNRLQYLNTQIVVVFDYIKVFFWPSQLEVEKVYDIASEQIVLTPQLAFHIGLVGMAISLIKRIPIISFAILFYYSSQSIESSIIPIADVAFEHRTYLSDFGFCLLISFAIIIVLPRFGLLGKKTVIIAIGSILLLLSITTYQRNEQWKNPEKLLLNELSFNVPKPRIHNMLGDIYLGKGQNQQAIEQYRKAFEISSNTESKVKNQGAHQADKFLLNTIAAMRTKGDSSDAIVLLENSLDTFTTKQGISTSFSYLGFLYLDEKRGDMARMAFERSLKFNNKNPEALAGLVVTYRLSHETSKAMAFYKKLVFLEGDSERVLLIKPLE